MCFTVCTSTDYVSGGEMFTHLYQRDHFPEEAVRIYIGEIILALEHLHKVGVSPPISLTLLPEILPSSPKLPNGCCDGGSRLPWKH